MPNGFRLVLIGAVAATRFYFGAKMVTTAADESAVPERAVARVTNSMIMRVLIFYIGSVALILLIVPCNDA